MIHTRPLFYLITSIINMITFLCILITNRLVVLFVLIAAKPEENFSDKKPIEGGQKQDHEDA